MNWSFTAGVFHARGDRTHVEFRVGVAYRHETLVTEVARPVLALEFAALVQPGAEEMGLRTVESRQLQFVAVGIPGEEPVIARRREDGPGDRAEHLLELGYARGLLALVVRERDRPATGEIRIVRERLFDEAPCLAAPRLERHRLFLPARADERDLALELVA